MTLCVILNTIVLALYHHNIEPDMEDALDQLNFSFTVIFAAEMALKLIGLGPKRYSKDYMNLLDGSVVVLSLMELVLLDSNSPLTVFRTVRIFRTFRVLRVARLFRYMRVLGRIIRTVSESISDFTYLALLLLLLIMIFALIGMQMFGGRFDFPDGKPRENFDDFHNAFVTVFQVLSMENW
jgi:hypothetical protein